MGTGVQTLTSQPRNVECPNDYLQEAHLSRRTSGEHARGKGHPVPAAIEKYLSAVFRGTWSRFQIPGVDQQAVVMFFPWDIQKANGWLSRGLQQLRKAVDFKDS